MNEDRTLKRARLIASLAVLAASVGIAFVIWKLKPDAESREPQEAVLVADLITARPIDTGVTVTTHGIARPVNVVRVSSEVAGRILNMPEDLDVGNQVVEGQMLVQIDPEDYEAAVQEAEAALARLDATLARLEATEKTTRAQIEVSRRSRDLAKADFDRLTRLSEDTNTVSQAVAESAERVLAQAEVQVLQLEQTLELIPSQRAETQSERQAAVARLRRATTQLNRTTITAPFTGRIVASFAEQDAYLVPATPVFEIADDRVMELQVPVQSSELNKWIPFQSSPQGSAWFPPLQPIDVSITWTGSDEGYTWKGRLDRVVSFDATTRTALLAIRVSGERLQADQGAFPLSEGMFCRVTIPGKTLRDVFALPREAVSFDNQVFLSVEGRLKTVDVSVAWSTEDTAYVRDGIQEGDRVVGTRLVSPLEGVKLRDTDND